MLNKRVKTIIYKINNKFNLHSVVLNLSAHTYVKMAMKQKNIDIDHGNNDIVKIYKISYHVFQILFLQAIMAPKVALK